MLTRVVWIVLLAALSAGCVTTGDPTRGGLLGWSENEAKVRRADLERKAHEARQRAKAAQANQHELESREREFAGTVSGLETKLAKLMAENAELRESFAKLMTEQELANADLKKLQTELNRTEQEFSRVPPISFAEEREERIKLQNKRLNSAILLLLQQR